MIMIGYVLLHFFRFFDEGKVFIFSGFPAFVYLILNRTIGREVLKSLKIGKWKNSSVTTTNASKVVVSTATASQI